MGSGMSSSAGSENAGASYGDLCLKYCETSIKTVDSESYGEMNWELSSYVVNLLFLEREIIDKVLLRVRENLALLSDRKIARNPGHDFLESEFGFMLELIQELFYEKEFTEAVMSLLDSGCAVVFNDPSRISQRKAEVLLKFFKQRYLQFGNNIRNSSFRSSSLGSRRLTMTSIDELVEVS